MSVIISPTDTKDVQWIQTVEQHPENRDFVYQWTETEHLMALSDSNIAHYTAYDGSQKIGYVILEGLNDHSRNLNLRRLVITKKNRGYGTIVLYLIQKLAFEEFNAHRLWLDVFTDNKTAYTLYKKVGFREEGLLHESYLRNEKYASQYIMAILASEYYQ